MRLSMFRKLRNSLLLALAIPTILFAQNPVQGNQRLTWDQPASSLAAANALVVKTYLNPPPQGPVLTNGLIHPFSCVGTTSPFTCQLGISASALVGNLTGVNSIAISVQTKNSDGTLTPEVISNQISFRVDGASASIPSNLRFSNPIN